MSAVSCRGMIDRLEERIDEMPGYARDYGIRSLKFYGTRRGPAASCWIAGAVYHPPRTRCIAGE